jgi:hypothetical protein
LPPHWKQYWRPQPPPITNPDTDSPQHTQLHASSFSAHCLHHGQHWAALALALALAIVLGLGLGLGLGSLPFLAR